MCAQNESECLGFGASHEVVAHRDSLEVVSKRVRAARSARRLRVGGESARAMLRGSACKSRRVAPAVRWRVWDMSGVEDIDDAHGHTASGTHQPLG